MAAKFPPIRFKGKLRPSQEAAVAAARRDLDAGRRSLHIVAPPGSGKTILGLYVWAEIVRAPAVALSPNSAIQAQWAARLDLFDGHADGDVASLDPQSPSHFTSLTYQSVTLPRRGGDDLDARAAELWIATLIEKGEAASEAGAEAWIDDLRRRNPAYHEKRLAAYRKQARDALALGGEALATLHASALATLARLRDRGVGLLILDECHHLLGHWGRALAEAHREFGSPVILGLTATPPDRAGKEPADVERYDAFLGPVDYEVPIPAVIKDGHLAPFQDLAYFVRPTPEELAFVANADDAMKLLIEDLSAPASPGGAGCEEPLPDWIARVLSERWLPAGAAGDWAAFERRDPSLALASRRFLAMRSLPLPEGVPAPPPATDAEPDAWLSTCAIALDRYIRHRLRRSESARDHELAEAAIQRLRALGIQIAETGMQPCASPAGRVLAYSKAKTQALIPILKEERKALGDRIRAVVVADYEKTSAVDSTVEGILDEEAGGAIAAFRALISDPETDALGPILVTGSTVLVEDGLVPRVAQPIADWLAKSGAEAEIEWIEEKGFKILRGSGGDWSPQLYVGMITELFQRGLTRCLVGTRGLLGEGWDATKANVLVDLTTATTSMTVNQLRGRTIRLDPEDPEKLADNWDVVCVAPEFAKGLDDYRRFIAKHDTLFGLTDDGAVEKGVGHVHPAFTELRPEGIEGSAAALNDEMLRRVHRRREFRALWRIGEPYRGKPVKTIEARLAGGGGFPPFQGARSPWSGASLAAAIGGAILAALRETKQVASAPAAVHCAERAGGYVRLFLENATPEESALFAESLHEALGPLDRPRYVIPRSVDRVEDTWISRLLPEVIARHFRARRLRTEALHAVPSALAANKDLVAVYERHWNRLVSPGEAVYAHRGEGEEMVRAALEKFPNSAAPAERLHDKEVFL